MKAFMAVLLLSTFISLNLQAADSICYSGKFTVGSGQVKLKYTIKNNSLHVVVLNPEDIISTSAGEKAPVKDLFDPGPDMKLIPIEGLRCPCTALQTEKGNFTFIVEQLGDRSERATMNYFGMKEGAVEAISCK